MLFNFSRIIAEVSKYFTLQQGDLIAITEHRQEWVPLRSGINCRDSSLNPRTLPVKFFRSITLYTKYNDAVYLFTSESVSEGHPDKVADQISDALIDHFLAFDPHSKVACETLVTTGQVILAGEVEINGLFGRSKHRKGCNSKDCYTKSEYMFEADSCGGYRLFTNSLLTLIKELIAQIRKIRAPETRV